MKETTDRLRQAAEHRRKHRLISAFEGKTIKEIDASSINVVRFTFTDGTQASIGADDTYYGVPVVGSDPWDGDSC